MLQQFVYRGIALWIICSSCHFKTVFPEIYSFDVILEMRQAEQSTRALATCSILFKFFLSVIPLLKDRLHHVERQQGNVPSV